MEKKWRIIGDDKTFRRRGRKILFIAYFMDVKHSLWNGIFFLAIHGIFDRSAIFFVMQPSLRVTVHLINFIIVNEGKKDEEKKRRNQSKSREKNVFQYYFFKIISKSRWLSCFSFQGNWVFVIKFFFFRLFESQTRWYFSLEFN